MSTKQPDISEVARRLEEIRGELRRHAHLYHVESRPEIDDAAYDQMFVELQALEASHPHLITLDSPSQRVGAEPQSAFPNAEHTVPMLSLDSTQDPEEVRRFDERVRKGLEDEPRYQLSNFASGVLIVLFRPYRVGDWVEAAGISGSVEQVQILTTILKTGDNKQIIVPNSQIMDSIITNYSANDTRRVDMVVGVSYDDDIDKVRKTLQDLIAAEDRILDEPATTIAVSELADSSVNFVVRPWVKSLDYSSVKFDMTEAIKKRFDQEGISFPFPQTDVHLYKQSTD